jgi:ATP-dependent Clp protease protease subunit
VRTLPKVIKLSGIVGWDISAQELEKQLPTDESDVIIHVDSQGGSVYEGNRLFNLLKDYEGKITIVLGALAASAASYFPLAVGPENIKVRENTTFMGHKAWSFVIGNADFMKAEAEILDGFDQLIAKIYSRVTGKTIEDTLNDMSEEFWFIGGQSIIDAGFASGFLEEEKTEEQTEEDKKTVTKAEVKALIQEAKNILQEKGVSEDQSKWAAELKIRNEINNSDRGVKPEGEVIEEENSIMEFDEILKSNPDAKAEYEKRIKAARKEGVENVLTEDRERFAKILSLSGVKVPENILQAALDGKTAESFAVEEVERRNKALESSTELPDLGGVTNPEQKPQGQNKKTKLDNDLEKVDAIFGKKQEGA